jgi:hypothetical protein
VANESEDPFHLMRFVIVCDADSGISFSNRSLVPFRVLGEGNIQLHSQKSNVERKFCLSCRAKFCVLVIRPGNGTINAALVQRLSLVDLAHAS